MDPCGRSQGGHPGTLDECHNYIKKTGSEDAGKLPYYY